MKNTYEKQQIDKVHKRVESIKGFYMHLAIYLTVNILFFIFWCVDSWMPKTFWKPSFFIMIVIAGSAVLAHGLFVFGAKYILPKDWEEKQIKKIMSKNKKES